MAFGRLVIAVVLAGVVALAGCTTADVLSLKDKAPLPKDAIAFMEKNGMSPASPIFMRLFKEEGVLEIWKQGREGKYLLVKSYPICAYSGGIGPKIREGDRQAPEGFYFVRRNLLNPKSNYFLSFDMGFPNAYDRAHGRTGANLMIHGACSSAGCYAMTDENISEIYAFAREALMGGRQDAFQVQALPFRMTPENMARHRDSRNFDFWKMIKTGYDQFELTKVPPKVDVCAGRYVFNQQTEDGGEIAATRACPQDMHMPPALATAYQAMQTRQEYAFRQAVAKLEGRDPAKLDEALPMTPIPQGAAN